MSLINYPVWTFWILAEQWVRQARGSIRAKRARARIGVRALWTKQNREALAWYITIGPAVSLFAWLCYMQLTV